MLWTLFGVSLFTTVFFLCMFIIYKIRFSSSKKELSLMTRQLSDMKNKEVDIQAKVENVKDEMKLITDLYIASDTLIHLTDEESVYAEIVQTLTNFYHCSQFVLYALNEDTGHFIKKHCYPESRTFPDEIDYYDMKTQDIKDNQMISTMVLNSQEKPLYYIKIAGRRNKTSLGYIDGVFTDTDLNVFDIYLKQSSMVLDKIKAYDKMERMALTDSLTGLYNRHYAYMRIKEEVKRATRENYPISILFVDIDKFKSINDTFGHDVGDLALKHVSSIVKEASREYDVAIRWGGEEFVLILPNTTIEGARILAERLRKNIEESNFEYCKITSSLGAAIYPDDNINIDKVISFADTALYYSKQSGRNRTSIYSAIAHMVQK